MPIWLSIVLSLVVRFGLPVALTWLKKRFPGLPIPADVATILEELAAKLAGQKVEKKAAVADAKAKLAQCFGDECRT